MVICQKCGLPIAKADAHFCFVASDGEAYYVHKACFLKEMKWDKKT